MREGWLTADVLTETLKKFTSTGATEYVADYIGQSPKVVEAALKEAEAMHGEADAIEYASKALAEKYGKNQDEIKQALQFAKNAEDAATKVKTFSQLWDVMKESAQSGWSQTWKAIVGDFEEAKSLLTPLADTLTGFINKMSHARNFVVENVMDFAAPWTAITEKLGKVKEVAESVTKVTDKLEYFQKVVNDVWRGDYKNSDTGRFDLLKAAGYDHRVVQDLVNLGHEHKITMEDIEASHKKFGLTLETNAEETKEVTKALEGLDEETLRNAGLTEDEIRLYKDLEKHAGKYGMTVDELAKKMSETSGRDLLIEGFKNVGSAIVNVFKAIGNAWNEIFDPVSVVGVYMALEKFRDWSESLQLVDKETGELNETGKKIQRTFKGVFAIVDVLTTILGGGLKIAFKVVSGILKFFGKDILDVTAFVGDAAVKFRDWFDALFDIEGMLEKAKNGLESLGDLPGVKHLIESFDKLVKGLKKLDISPLSALGSGVVFVFDRIAGKIKELTGIDIGGFFKDIFGDIISAVESLTGLDLSGAGENIFDGLMNGLRDGARGVIDTITEAAANLIDKFCEILGIHSPSTVFIAIGGFIIAGLISGLQQGLISVPDSLQAIFDKCIAVIQGIDWGTIMSLGISVAGLVFIKKIGDALENFSAPFAGLGEILENTADLVKTFRKVVKSLGGVMKSVSFNINMKAIKQLAVAIAILTGAVIAIVYVADGDYTNMLKAVGIIAALAGVLVGLSFAMRAMSDASVKIGKEGVNIDGLKSSLLSIAVAIGVLAIVVKLIGSMKPEEAIQGFIGLVGIAGAILAFIYICQKITTGGVSDNVSKIGGLMIKLAIALGLMVGVCKLVGMLSVGEMIKGAGFVAALGIFIVALTKIARSAGNNVGKVGGMLLKVSIAMMLMIGVCKLASKLSVGEMLKGAAFAIGFGLLVKALVGILKIGKKTEIGKVGGTILAVALSMTLMVGVCKLVGMLSMSELAKGALFAAGFGLLIIALVSILKCGNETQRRQK